MMWWVRCVVFVCARHAGAYKPPCELQNKTTTLNFTTPEGDVCWSETEIPETECVGNCLASDGLQIRSVKDLEGHVISSGMHSSTCTRCTGTGYWSTQPVVCSSAGNATAEVYQYTSCQCTACPDDVHSSTTAAATTATASAAAVPWQKSACICKCLTLLTNHLQFSSDLACRTKTMLLTKSFTVC